MIVDSVIYKQVEEADEINKKSSSTVQSPSSSTKPKNADKNDDLEYSDSLKMDFTKLDINSKNHGEYNFFHIKNVLLQNINFGGQ
ncbi:unnamed protein product [Rhizophagus irregularis]|nr:unnamed protein product [Rhizophagus irregularis]